MLLHNLVKLLGENIWKKKIVLIVFIGIMNKCHAISTISTKKKKTQLIVKTGLISIGGYLKMGNGDIFERDKKLFRT